MSKFVLTAQLQLQGPKNVRQVVSQIQSQLKGVDVDVGIKNGPQAQRQLKQIADQSNRAAKAAGSMGKALGVSIRRFTGLAIATRAVSLFTNNLGAAIKESIAFERELIKISQVTGKTIKQLSGLTKSITSLATGLGVSSTSLLSTSRILSQAGLSAKQTEIALTALAKTELAPTFENITRTAEGAVAIFNQFGKGAAALEGQLGSLNAVAGKFAVESGDLIATIRRTGGVFKAAGGDLNELIALFTSVRSTTRESAESIATGLRTILTRIQRPKTIEYLRQYGVELETLEGKFVGPFEAVRRLSEATRGLEEGDLTFVKIAEQIAGFRQIGKVIPLLRQFRVAQEALQVAQGGTNSLTDDAAKAQAALAVRITKVKEEFLALIRSITETTAFQAMANTILTLAESLITLGEAIKPVLPLLGALFAARAIKGAGNFVRGVSGGLGARGFASGGMVPGSGNRDTVPAMLTPGEFVIKKSSVAKMGAANLQAMNNNRYNQGGKVGRILVNPGTVGGFFLSPEQGDPRNLPISGTETMSVTHPRALRRLGANTEKGMDSYFFGLTSPQQKSILGLKGKAASRYKAPTNKKQASSLLGANKGAKERLKRKQRSTAMDSEAGIADLSGVITGYFPGGNDLRANARVAGSVNRATKRGLISAVLEAAEKTVGNLNTVSPQISLNKQTARDGAAAIAQDNAAISTTSGYIFEGLISALTGAKLAGGQANFDFPNSSISGAKSGLAALFSSGDEGISNLLKADAKRSNTSKAKASIVNKIKNDINGGMLAGLSFQKYASGGAATGSDTVPAMLTPGEFVVNKASAKGIGYGNLKRMNQVGKYAAGGVVTPNRHFYGNGPMGSPGSIPGMDPRGFSNLSKAATKASRGLEGMEQKSNKMTYAMLGAQMVMSHLTPTIDENSTSFEKGAASVLSFTNTLMFTFMTINGLLSTFGIELSFANAQLHLQNAGSFIKDLTSFITKGSGPMMRKTARGAIGATRATAGALQSAGSRMAASKGTGLVGRGMRAAGGVTKGAAQSLAISSKAITKVAVSATRLATGIGAVTLVTEGLTMALGYFLDNTEAINAAIQAGDVEKAGAEARTQKSTQDAINTVGGAASGAGMGALIGTLIAPGIGTAIGAGLGGAFGALDAWANGLDESVITQAEASAGVVRANKEIAQSASEAAQDIKDFNAGLRDSTFEGSATAKSRDEVSLGTKNIDKLIQDQREAARPDTMGYTVTNALFGRNEKTKETEIKAATETQNKLRREAFDTDAGRRTAEFKKAAQRGESFENTTSGFGQKAQQAEIDKVVAKEREALAAGDEVASESYRKQHEELSQQLRESNKEFYNIQKSVAEARAKFDALNIGLSQSAAAIGGASVGIDNLMNSMDSGTPKLTSSIATLEASTTAAAGGISPENMQGALDDVSNSLLEYGADPAEINKFRQNQTALMAAQSELPSVFERMKDQLGTDDLRNMAPTDLNDAFRDSMRSQLESQGMDQSGIDRVMTALPDSGELSKEQVKALEAGDLDVFQESLTEAGKEAFEKVKEQAEEAAKIEKQMIELTKRRIEAENNLIKAQQTAIDIGMEARNVEAEFGGKAVSIEERRSAVAARSNVLGRSAGLSDVGTDVASFRRRREEIRQGFSATQLQPGQQQTAENEAQGDRLKQAQQEQVQSLRELIKIQKDEIKTIQEKQRLEKESLDSLLSGDIDKFFEQQAAQGAIAASATGNQSLMNSFGASAMGAASQELGRMRAAGVTEIYGQQIGGPGGLQERSALSGLQQRGLQGQGAVRAAQIQAGTTPEQAEAEARTRELAGELAAAGDLGADMAGDELVTAGKMLQEAARILQEGKDNAQASQDRGELTGAGLKQGRVVTAQEGNVNAARDKLTAAQEAHAKVQEDLAEKNRRFSAHVAYRTKVEREGGTLSAKEEEAYRAVLDEKIKATGDAAASEQQVLTAQGKLQEEEAVLQQELNKAKAIDTEMRKGRLEGPAADMTRPESAPKSMVGGFLEAIGFGSQDRPSTGTPSRADMLNSTGAGGGTGGAPSVAGVANAIGMDEDSLSALGGFSQTVDKLAGTEIAMQMAEIPINLNAPNFLTSMEPAVQNMVIDAIQKELENVRPSSGGMKTNKGVLPQKQA